MSESKALEFKIGSYEARTDDNTLEFAYETELLDGTHLQFRETIVLPCQLTPELLERPDVVAAVESLHILLGISYFKMHLSTKISLPYKLSSAQADFWNRIYTQGLGEFYYTNGIDFRGLVNFPYTGDEKPVPHSVFSSQKALVLHGGGKDSLVSVEVMKAAGTDFDLFSVNTSDIQEKAAQAVGKEAVVVKRTVDPQLIELQRSDNVYKGHVPISAIYALLSVLFAVVAEYGYVVASNEASANYGNVDYLGMTVNHQWSKSKEAEDLVQNYIETYITKDVRYFSLLRPLHELAIVKIFSQFDEYFLSFSSSNHNFTMPSSENHMSSERWDISYSKGKVEFVFALFAACVSKTDVLRIFEFDVFAFEDAIRMYEKLLGLKEIKPLDCVGTPEETALALYYAHYSGEYKGEPVMNMFEESVLPQLNLSELEKEVLSYGNDSRIPHVFSQELRKMFERSV